MLLIKWDLLKNNSLPDRNIICKNILTFKY